MAINLKDLELAIARCPSSDRRVWLEAQDWKIGMGAYAAEGCYFGLKGQYWEIWKALADMREMQLLDAMKELPPHGPRWLALWLHGNGDTESFIEAYEFFLNLNDPRKIGPIAHENGILFSELYRQGDHRRIIEWCDRLFKNPEPNPGVPGYLIENCWKILALAAIGEIGRALSEAGALVTQFPNAGTAWVVAAFIERQGGDTTRAELARQKAAKCEYIDAAISWIAKMK